MKVINLGKGIFSTLTLILIIGIFSSCHNNRSECAELSEPFESGEFGKNIADSVFAEYVDASSGVNKPEQKPNSEVRIYVDRSSGINEAFSSTIGGPTALKQIGQIVAKYNNAVFLGVLDSIQQIALDHTYPGTYLSDGKNYDAVKGAKLRDAMETIVSNNQLAFFISDCEEFDDQTKEVLIDPWAKNAFIKWLSCGNSINFWITDYKKNNVIKHLYFIAFVPRQAVFMNHDYSDLVKDLNGINPVHLELTNKNWRVQPPQWPEQSTGLDKELLKKGVFVGENYLRNWNHESAGYEFMDISYPLKGDVIKQSMSSKDLYRNLFVDFSSNHFFNINKMDIDVYDVTDDLRRFITYYQVKRQVPNITTDEKGAKILDPKDQFSCFYTYESGPKIRNEYNYTPSYKQKDIKELFAFNDELFNNTLANNPDKTELGITLHPSYNTNNPLLKNGKSYIILRVDFKIKDFDTKAPDLSMFKWYSAVRSNTGRENTGLQESIKQAIDATKPAGKIVHSLYIKLLNEN
ncbi:MAG: hypothetical protein U0T75_04680 [Chitinophagales bacterium]